MPGVTLPTQFSGSLHKADVELAPFQVSVAANAAGTPAKTTMAARANHCERRVINATQGVETGDGDDFIINFSMGF